MRQLLTTFKESFARLTKGNARGQSFSPLSARSLFMIVITAIVAVILVFSVAIYGLHKDTATTRSAEKVIPYPAAMVNWSPILLRDYNFARDYTRHFYVASKLDFTESAMNKQILDQLIEQKIITQHARKANITVTKSEIDQAYQKLEEKSGKDEVGKVLNDLYGLNQKQFKDLIYHQILRSKVESFYQEKGQWRQVQVRHLLIKVDPAADDKTVEDGRIKAENNLKSVQAGKSLEEVAKANSEDVESKDQGGELGYINRGQTVKEFEDAVFAAKKGDLLGPIHTKYGWHIIQVEDIKGDNDFVIWREQAKIYQLIKI